MEIIVILTKEIHNLRNKSPTTFGTKYPQSSEKRKENLHNSFIFCTFAPFFNK